MTARIELDMAAISDLYHQGLRYVDIAEKVGANMDTVASRIREMVRAKQLPPRQRAKTMQPRKFVKVPPPVQHVAAVRMPADPVRDRPDWPDIEAAINRAHGSTVALGQVAARFRLPYAVVLGQAQKVVAG